MFESLPSLIHCPCTAACTAALPLHGTLYCRCPVTVLPPCCILYCPLYCQVRASMMGIQELRERPGLALDAAIVHGPTHLLDRVRAVSACMHRAAVLLVGFCPFLAILTVHPPCLGARSLGGCCGLLRGLEERLQAPRFPVPCPPCNVSRTPVLLVCVGVTWAAGGQCDCYHHHAQPAPDTGVPQPEGTRAGQIMGISQAQSSSSNDAAARSGFELNRGRHSAECAGWRGCRMRSQFSNRLAAGTRMIRWMVGCIHACGMWVQPLADTGAR